MKRLLITLVLLISLVMAFGADATFTKGTPTYSSSGTFTITKATCVLLASGATLSYFETAALDGNKLSGKQIVISGTITTNTITNTGTDVAYLRPDIYVSADGTNYSLLASCPWAYTSALTVGINSTFTLNLTGVSAPYYKVRWQAITTAFAVTTGGITAGGITTVISSK